MPGILSTNTTALDFDNRVISTLILRYNVVQSASFHNIETIVKVINVQEHFAYGMTPTTIPAGVVWDFPLWVPITSGGWLCILS